MGSELKSSPFVHASDFVWVAAGDGVRRGIPGFSPEPMMDRVEFKAGSIGYIHTHRRSRATYVDGGKFRAEAGGKKKEPSAVDRFVGPDVPHGVEALEDGSLVDVISPVREDFLGGKK